ncbi:hypothetical protein EMPG_16537 [Blastomyces silverae]|uniref:Uncharacterized protein n=1 Tax=Blastomyces silverae TaxID=2060906 RepID=A0A0H1BFN6_9EURO|nr:hypothetical protein EMPG_16537 [Blastomyces silverae]
MMTGRRGWRWMLMAMIIMDSRLVGRARILLRRREEEKGRMMMMGMGRWKTYLVMTGWMGRGEMKIRP